jgi:hypothetical protein
MVFFGLPDSPSRAWFLTAEEKQRAVIRLVDNQTGIETRKVNLLQSIIMHSQGITDSTLGFQTQPGSGNIPRPSMLLHMDLCIRIRKLMPASQTSTLSSSPAMDSARRRRCSWPLLKQPWPWLLAQLSQPCPTKCQMCAASYGSFLPSWA